MAIPRLVERHPDERQGEAVNHGSKHQKVDRRFPVLPVGAVQTQQNLPWWEMHDEQRDEKAHVQLVIPEGAVRPPFLGLWRADTGHVGTQIVMIDAPRGNHRQEDIDEPLERVDAEVTGVRFEVPGECGSLLDSGFCGLHTFRRPRTVSPIKLDGADCWFSPSGTRPN